MLRLAKRGRIERIRYVEIRSRRLNIEMERTRVARTDIDTIEQ